MRASGHRHGARLHHLGHSGVEQIVWLLPLAIMVLGLPLVAIVKLISAVVSAVRSAP